MSIDQWKSFPDTEVVGALNLSLSDRTAVVSGPFGPMMQNLASTLSENGADVAIVVASEHLNMAQRFCHNLMDLREVSERYGRSAAIEFDFKDEASAQDAFSRSAEIFGTTDIYIDTHLAHLKIPFGAGANLSDAENQFSEAFQKAHVISGVALNFIRNRSKSRLLYVVSELDLFELERLGSQKGREFKEYILNLCQETSKEQITVNALALGVSEDYLISRGAGQGSIQAALKKMQEVLPGAKLVDYADVSATISFLVSPLSTAINGQMIALDHGLKIPAKS